MYIISVYDVSTITKEGKRRLPKIMKKFRAYLNHVQKSVFEGELTEAGLKALKIEIKKLIKDKEDFVIFYRIDNKNNLKREFMGKDFDPASNFI